MSSGVISDGLMSIMVSPSVPSTVLGLKSVSYFLDLYQFDYILFSFSLFYSN
jgi:hypothetical protein